MAIKIGELLLKAKVIDEKQLKAALDEQKRWGGKLGEILVRMTFVSEDMMVKALSKQLNVPRIDLDALPPVPKPVLHRIPHEVARDLQSVALQLKDDKTLVVAMADPVNLVQLDTLNKVTRCKVTPMISSATQIARMIARSYEDGDEQLDNDNPAGHDAGADGGGEGEHHEFKLVDSQGKTLVKNVAEYQARVNSEPSLKTAPPPPVGTPPSIPAAPPASASAEAQGQASALIANLEDVQRREITALKAMVELLIEKGVFSREEYLARVRR
jgi:hypothetical protein